MALPQTLRRRKVPGTMQASSPTWVCNYARAAVSRLAAGLAMDRRGGFHIRPRNPRAAARSGGMGHPALRPPGWPPPFGLAQNIKFIRRGGIHPARGTPRRHRGPGRCKHRPLHGFAIMQGPWFPGWSCALPPVVGADSISARGNPRRRKVRRDEGIPPYVRPDGRRPPVWPNVCRRHSGWPKT